MYLIVFCFGGTFLKGCWKWSLVSSIIPKNSSNHDAGLWFWKKSSKSYNPSGHGMILVVVIICIPGLCYSTQTVTQAILISCKTAYQLWDIVVANVTSHIAAATIDLKQRRVVERRVRETEKSWNQIQSWRSHVACSEISSIWFYDSAYFGL